MKKKKTWRRLHRQFQHKFANQVGAEHLAPTELMRPASYGVSYSCVRQLLRALLSFSHCLWLAFEFRETSRGTMHEEARVVQWQEAPTARAMSTPRLRYPPSTAPSASQLLYESLIDITLIREGRAGYAHRQLDNS